MKIYVTQDCSAKRRLFLLGERKIITESFSSSKYYIMTWIIIIELFVLYNAFLQLLWISEISQV